MHMSEAPRPRPRPLVEQFSHVVRAYTSSLALVTTAAADALGVNSTDHRCIELIERAGELTAGQLAEASGLTTGAITTVLDRLERAGYIQRLRDPADRRRVVVQTTALARRRSQAIFGPLIAESRAMLADYSDEQLALLTDFLERGQALNQRHAARIRDLGTSPDALDDPALPRAAWS
jgi:DNA-binding MarR family transcriptional regulator